MPSLQEQSPDDTGSQAVPELSVVIGSVDSARSIEACLESIFAAGKQHRIEVLLIDASSDDTVDRARQAFPAAQLVTRPPGTLTPVLWADGISLARGRMVALTTGHCVASECWLEALASAHTDGASAAGGPLILGNDASTLDAAIYFLRYSAFLPTSDTDPREVHEIAGDNAMYSLSSLRRYAGEFADGFWEPEFHAALRAEGGRIELVPQAAMSFSKSFPFATIALHRYRHGRHFGEWRVRSGAQRVTRAIAAAPFVPFVLLARVAMRVGRQSQYRWRLIVASPAILALAACWAAGEAAGALEARNADRR